MYFNITMKLFFFRFIRNADMAKLEFQMSQTLRVIRNFM